MHWNDKILEKIINYMDSPVDYLILPNAFLPPFSYSSAFTPPPTLLSPTPSPSPLFQGPPPPSPPPWPPFLILAWTDS